MKATNKQVLKISSGGRIDGSVSRDLSDNLISAIEDRYGATDIAHRDLAAGIPFVDEAWIEANFTPEELRTEKQRSKRGLT